MIWNSVTLSGRSAFLFMVFVSACLLPVSVMCQGEILEMGVKVNSEFKISLESNPTTGYKWEAKFDENLLKLKSDDFSRPSEAIVGQGGTQTFVFLPVKVGAATIAFHYKRSWEKEPAKIRQYKVTIKP